jgi:hypothetical protein
VVIGLVILPTAQATPPPRPSYPSYRPGAPGYVRPPAPPAGARPPYPPARPPVNPGAPRPTPYPAGQGANNRPVNPAYRPNTAMQQPTAKPVPKPNVKVPTTQPSTSEYRGYQRQPSSGSPAAQPARPNAFSASAGARAQSARGNQSLTANSSKRVATNL